MYRSNGSKNARPTIGELLAAKDEAAMLKRTRSHSFSGVAYDLAMSEGDTFIEDEIPNAEAGYTKLGWVVGCFIPCVLNIWGVIMFLRIGWVVGQAGLLVGSVICWLANLVTFLTGLSLCAICTNGEVKGGGLYYFISRSLGASYGGAIGILFFIAQSIAASMYIVGFSESMLNLLDLFEVDYFTGSEDNDLRVIGLIVTCVLSASAYIGVGWYAKTQTGMLFVLSLAIFAVFIGAFFPNVGGRGDDNKASGFIGYDYENGRNLWPQWSTEKDTMISHSFMTVFSVYFPAVTGIMAGANLSGDLKDPQTAVPKGTMWAIFVTFLTYWGLMLIVGLSSTRCYAHDPALCAVDFDEEWAENVTKDETPTGGLLFNKLIMAHTAIWSPLLYGGVFAATLSSALASIVAAPRILQAVAADKIFPIDAINWFGFKRADGEPTRGYYVAFPITIGCVLIGKLDLIAPIISNFFMIAYGLVNYCCFAAATAKTPGWRPSFKYYHKYLSLFAAILCLVIMFAMDWIYSIASIAIGVGIYQYLEYVDPDVNWGPAGENRKYVTTLRAANRLVGAKKNVKTYRPNFLVMAGDIAQRPSLMAFMGALKKSRGVVLLLNVLVDRNVGVGENADTQHVDQNAMRPSSSSASAADSGVKGVGEGKEGGEEEVRWMRPVDEREYGKVFHGSDGARGETRADEAREAMDAAIDASPELRGQTVFADALVAFSLRDGFKAAAQIGGMGPFRPNACVFGFKKNWKSDPVGCRNYEGIVKDCLALRKGVVIFRDDMNAFPALLPKTNAPSFSPAAGAASTSAAAAESGHGCIDVWWLVDDGGLTMLLPYLLKRAKEFEGRTLRVMTVTNLDNETTVHKLEESEAQMVKLLSKFRIAARVVSVDANPMAEVSAATVAAYEALGFCVPRNSAGQFSRSSKTHRMLRMGEVMREHSARAAVVFATLPLPPVAGEDPVVGRFMSWLEIMTANLPPTVLLRGNNESVLTFYS